MKSTRLQKLDNGKRTPNPLLMTKGPTESPNDPNFDTSRISEYGRVSGGVLIFEGSQVDQINEDLSAINDGSRKEKR